MKKILGLDISGNPRAWLTLENAVTYHAKEQVAWSHGPVLYTAHGGYQRSGIQSKISTASIIAIRAASGFTLDKIHKDLPVSNQLLFRRDNFRCGYCGKEFHPKNLSRDHIIPKSRGGKDTWLNVVASCRDCNCEKDDMLLSECGMVLLHKPYAPTRSELLFTHNHCMTEEQYEYLVPMLPRYSRMINLHKHRLMI